MGTCNDQCECEKTMTFGAWCVRDYGFDYEDVRTHNGIALFPVVEDGGISWEMNPANKSADFQVIDVFAYPQFHIEEGKPIYRRFVEVQIALCL